jgi:hypothetical protein
MNQVRRVTIRFDVARADMGDRDKALGPVATSGKGAQR